MRPSVLQVCLLASALLVGAVAVAAATSSARALSAFEARYDVHVQAGDVVLQDLDCGIRCELIRRVTHSSYAHVGIVLDDDGAPVVWEAFHPVAPTALADWLVRGRGGRMALYRFDDVILTQLPSIDRQVRAMEGLPYDADYLWDDERIYCSELVAKAVNRAMHVDVFAPKPLGPGAFGADASVVARMSQGRLTDSTPLVSPADLVRSPRLHRIVDELAAQ